MNNNQATGINAGNFNFEAKAGCVDIQNNVAFNAAHQGPNVNMDVGYMDQEKIYYVNSSSCISL